MRRLRIALCAAFLVLFFLFPYTIPALGFSPHIVPLVLGFILSIKPLYDDIRSKERWLIAAFLLTFLSSLMVAPADVATLRAWTLSLMAYGLLRVSFSHFDPKALRYGSNAILLVWSLTSILEIFLGPSANVSAWFGMPSGNIVHATGLTLFSSQAAAIVMVLCLWVLMLNLDRITPIRLLLWMSGIAALYFTLSRAAWLGLFIGLGILAWQLKYDTQRFRLMAYAAAGAFAVMIAWALPAQYRDFEPGGSVRSERWTLQQDDSIAMRKVAFRMAMQATKDHPFTGIGLGQFPDFYLMHYDEFRDNLRIEYHQRIGPHNGYLQFLAEMGISTFIALMVWVAYVVWETGTLTSMPALGLYVASIALLVWLGFHDGFYDRLWWIVLGCAAALRHTPSCQTTRRT